MLDIKLTLNSQSRDLASRKPQPVVQRAPVPAPTLLENDDEDDFPLVPRADDDKTATVKAKKTDTKKAKKNKTKAAKPVVRDTTTLLPVSLKRFIVPRAAGEEDKYSA